jgi:hypothetical protein
MRELIRIGTLRDGAIKIKEVTESHFNKVMNKRDHRLLNNHHRVVNNKIDKITFNQEKIITHLDKSQDRKEESR